MTWLLRLIGALIVLLIIGMAAPLLPYLNRWYQLVIVQSGSMEPALRVGSLAIYSPTATYRVGDVLAYQEGDGVDAKLVLHRLVERRVNQLGESLLLRGDANSEQSATTAYPGQVKGKLIGSIPNAGYVIHWLQSTSGVLTVVVIVTLLMIIAEVRLK